MPNVNYRGFSDRSYLLNGSPTQTLEENFPRDQASTDLVGALASGVMTSVAVELAQGDVINSLTFLSGATAAGTPTNEWVALYDTTGALLAQSATITTAWALNTAKTFTLTVPQAISVTGIYYAAVMVAATTVPTLVGKPVASVALSDGIIAGQPNLAQTSGTGLTNTAPATIVTPTAVAVVPYVVLM